MKRAAFRSTIFNLCFYVITGITCIFCLPTLALPRPYFMSVVKFFVHKVYFLERFILGLDYEVRGGENVPKNGSFIVAAKHQSAYETMKLHILFKDPAVILKKELLSIPLWGLYLKKSDPIAIDRSTPDAAIESIQNGARRMKELGRPIVIFPQGTRVHTDVSANDKAYKVGVARLQEATDLPIVPMALNAGIFWPRNSWLKSPGRVIFEFLKPIEPGLERGKLLAQLEKQTEDRTQSLMNEAREADMSDKACLKGLCIGLTILLALLFAAYSFVWFAAAERIKVDYIAALSDLNDSQSSISPPEVIGYPGKLTLYKSNEKIATNEGYIQVNDLSAQGWPVPLLPVTVTTGAIAVKSLKWQEPLRFDSLYAKIKFNSDILTVQDSSLKQGVFDVAVKGTADLNQKPMPALDMIIQFTNHQDLLKTLVYMDIIDKRMAMFMAAGLGSLADEQGIVRLPLEQKDETLYAGPLPLMQIKTKQEELRREVKTPSPAAP